MCCLLFFRLHVPNKMDGGGWVSGVLTPYYRFARFMLTTLKKTFCVSNEYYYILSVIRSLHLLYLVCYSKDPFDPEASIFNLFTTIHDGNFRRHSSMNVTIK